MVEQNGSEQGEDFMSVPALLDVRAGHEARRLDPEANLLLAGLSTEVLGRLRGAQPGVLGLADVREPSPGE